jgi:hypothetical protein
LQIATLLVKFRVFRAFMPRCCIHYKVDMIRVITQTPNERKSRPNLSQELLRFVSLLFLTNINPVQFPLAMHAKTPTLILPNLKLGFKFFSHNSLPSHIRTFFPVGQGSYSIVDSSMNTTCLHCCESHWCRLYANSLCLCFCPSLQNSFFLGIFRRKPDSQRIL